MVKISQKQENMKIRMFCAKLFFFYEIFFLVYLAFVLYVIVGPANFSFDIIMFDLLSTQLGFLILRLLPPIYNNLIIWLIISLPGIVSYPLIGYVYGIIIESITKLLKNKKSLISGIILLSVSTIIKLFYAIFPGRIIIPWSTDLFQLLLIAVPLIIFIRKYKIIK